MTDFSKYLPEAVLCLAALMILMVGASARLRAPRTGLSAAAILALAVAAALLDPAGSPFAWYARIVIVAVGALITAAYWNDVDDESPGEFLSSVLFSLAGAMLLVSADDLIVVFLGLELVSLPAYLLIALGRKHVEAQEAGNKYFFLSILSAAILLYGFSFLYGVTGTVRLVPTDPAAVRGAIVNLTEAERELQAVVAGIGPEDLLLVPTRTGFGAAGGLSVPATPEQREAMIRRITAPAEERVRAARAALSRTADDIPTRVYLIMGDVRSGRGAPALLIFGGLLAVVGIGFKLAAVPFHFYAPDVYQGSHHAVSAMLAFVPKAAGLFAVIRFVLPGLGPLIGPAADAGPSAAAAGQAWFGLLWFLAVASMTVGNVLALLQTNVKRMLAYSSIAHTGNLLVGVAAVSADPASLSSTEINRNGGAAALFYILVYGVMTLGAFAALALVQTAGGESAETLDDLAGLARRRPSVALAIAIFMFSLTGLPPTAGFLGKLTLFSSALSMPAADPSVVAGPHYWLVILGVLNSAVSATFYLGVAASMYLREPVGNVELSRSTPLRFTVAVCAALSLLWGVLPGTPMQRAVAAARERHDADVVRARPGATPAPGAARDR